MVMNGYSEFPKSPALLEPHHQIVKCHIKDSRWWGSHTSTEMQSVYSTALGYSLPFYILTVVSPNGKSHSLASSFFFFFFLLIPSRRQNLELIKLSTYISKSQGISFLRTDSVLCVYYLVASLSFNFLYNSQWTPFHTQSSLILSSLLHLVTMGLSASSLSPHNLHLLFLPIIDFRSYVIGPYGVVLSCF